MGNEAKILSYAQSLCEVCNNAEQIAETEAGTIYALALLDADGMPMPLGLPRLVIEKGSSRKIVKGKEALTLLDSLDLEK